MKCSDSPPPVPPYFDSFAQRLPVPRACLRHSAKSDADLGPGSFWSGPSPSGQSLQRWRRRGVPSSWGTLMCLRLALGPRRDQPARPLRQVGTAPRTAYRGGSPPVGNFGARSHGIGTRCLRFAVRLTPPHARLASGCAATLYQTGLSTRRVPTKGFRAASLHRFPLSQASWRRRCPLFRRTTAATAGIPERTLERANRELRVQSQQVKVNGRREWFWYDSEAPWPKNAPSRSRSSCRRWRSCEEGGSLR
jgi:hypothetical protein